MTDLQEAKNQLRKTYKFGYTVRNKSLQNRELCSQIEDFLSDYDVRLPKTKKDFQLAFDRAVRNGEEHAALMERFEDLIRMYYSIAETTGYYARFVKEESVRFVPLAFRYSRHRLCHVWNWRKSQIIRNRYYNFLRNAIDESGRMLLNTYRPIHLVLTVPHEGGKFQGHRFYARQIIERFNLLRKSAVWKKYVYAGEYGLEVKRSKSHGLHIHVHSFLLQYPGYAVTSAAAAIEGEWRKLVGNETTYSGIHYETLYTWKKDAAGNLVRDKRGQMVKDYVSPGSSDIQHYLSGIMECIKYHFKPDAIETDGGKFDILLIDEILTNTKGLRMYSRFGAFYKQSLLNFKALHNEPETETEEPAAVEDYTDTDEEPDLEELNTDVSGVEERLINPFTLQQAVRSDYAITIGNPTNLLYYSRESDIPYEPYTYTFNVFRWCPPLSLKEVIMMDCTGKLKEAAEAYAMR
ncbi:protein rep [Tellurirhabdus rosea]|uniref:protein rep n=1 Tax=Tellurirhabdus rosea TaxID=2674997 RepID=UPI0022561B10|nr:hypothetical protein [Tellurirhabdus rosea]